MFSWNYTRLCEELACLLVGFVSVCWKGEGERSVGWGGGIGVSFATKRLSLFAVVIIIDCARLFFQKLNITIWIILSKTMCIIIIYEVPFYKMSLTLGGRSPTHQSINFGWGTLEVRRIKWMKSSDKVNNSEIIAGPPAQSESQN